MHSKLAKEQIEALRRTGDHALAARLELSGAWHPSGFSLQVKEGVLDLADLDPIVENAQPEFLTIPIVRRAAIWPPEANGPVTTEFALLAIFSGIAFPFLAALGTDLYRAFRAGLFAAYWKAHDLGHRAPLGVKIESGEQPHAPITEDERRHLKPNLYFGFSGGMNAEEFERALQVLLRTYNDVEQPVGYFDVLLEWDSESGAWVEEEKE